MQSQEKKNSILPACIILFVLLSLPGTIHRQGVKLFAFYTQLSNLAGMVSSAVYLAKKGKLSSWELSFMHVSAGMLAMTMFVVFCVLIPMGAGFKAMAWDKGRIFTHVLVPLLFLLCWMKEDAGKLPAHSWCLTAAATIAYGVIMMILNGLGLFAGPYPFFEVQKQSIAMIVFWVILLGSVSAASGLLTQKLHACLSR